MLVERIGLLVGVLIGMLGVVFEGLITVDGLRRDEIVASSGWLEYKICSWMAAAQSILSRSFFACRIMPFEVVSFLSVHSMCMSSPSILTSIPFSDGSSPFLSKP